VESSVNSRDYSMRFRSRSRTFTANERNSNTKCLEESVGKTMKISTYFRSSEWTKWLKWSRGLLSFFWESKDSRKGYSPRSCCGAPGESRLVLSVARFCNEAIVGLNSEEVSSSPKDDGLDQVNEAIPLALSDEPFSSIRQIARKISVPKSCISAISSVCRFSAFHSQTSHIFIVFLTSSPTVNRQVDSSCRSNLATSCCPSSIKDRMRMHISL
jgi:hypothetical protein